MNRILIGIPVLIFSFASPLVALELADPLATARSHLESMLRMDSKKLELTYADKIVLMPGHEFLKEEYGLAGKGDRGKGATVDKPKLLKAIEKAAADHGAKSAEKIKKLMEDLGMQTLDARVPFDTPAGETQVVAKEGDILLKIVPVKGDFLILHMRKFKGKWKVVSEYID